MTGTALQRFRATLQRRGSAAFVAASLGVGIAVGLGAALLVWLTQQVRDLAEAGVDERSWLIIAVVPIGLLVAWGIAGVAGREIESGGVTETMVGLSLHSGYLPSRTILGKIGATAATLGAFGSGGREGPIVMIGGTIGSSLARHTRFGEDQIRGLVAAGAGAGIGATFGAPIAGMLFAMEVLLGNFAIRHLNAVVVASVAAAVTTRSLVGEEQLLSAPAHRLGHPAELLLYGAVGLLALAFSYLFLRVVENVAINSRAIRKLPGWVRPVVGGLIVGAVGLWHLDAIGTGQDFVKSLLSLSADNDAVWSTLIIIAVLKIVTNAVTRTAGGSAGTMMPSLFIGATVGAAFAVVVTPIWTLSDIDPGALAVVGMAATFAAVGRAPLTAILIVFEITGDYGLVLPLMLATSLATVLADWVHPESIYTVPLRRRGIHLLRREDIDLLDTVEVRHVMSWPGAELTRSMTTAEAQEIFDDQHHHGLPVVEGGELCGILTISDIIRDGGPSAERTVADAMTTNPRTVSASMPVSVAVARMAALDIGRLPVVADEDPKRFLGMFRRESVVRAYHHALGSATDRSMYRERIKQRTDPEATFYELPIPPLSDAGGRPVRDLDWPEGATLVSVRRGNRVIIPHGNTILAEGDTITAFGTGESRIDLAYMLEPPPPEPEDFSVE
jgi:CIC family chloride channel protein